MVTMVKYSTAKEFEFPERETVNVVVTTNGGSVQLAVWDGDAYVNDDLINTNGNHEVRTNGLKIRFTPSGGATFSVAVL